MPIQKKYCIPETDVTFSYSAQKEGAAEDVPGGLHG